MPTTVTYPPLSGIRPLVSISRHTASPLNLSNSLQCSFLFTVPAKYLAFEFFSSCKAEQRLLSKTAFLSELIEFIPGVFKKSFHVRIPFSQSLLSCFTPIPFNMLKVFCIILAQAPLSLFFPLPQKLPSFLLLFLPQCKTLPSAPYPKALSLTRNHRQTQVLFRQL